MPGNVNRRSELALESVPDSDQPAMVKALAGCEIDDAPGLGSTPNLHERGRAATPVHNLDTRVAARRDPSCCERCSKVLRSRAKVR